MRRLNRKKTLNLMKELDAFPKVPESYVETSASGGTVSLIAFTTIAFLTIMEFTVYRDTWMKYEYEVDKDFTSKLRINIDITVAMRCQCKYPMVKTQYLKGSSLYAFALSTTECCSKYLTNYF